MRYACFAILAATTAWAGPTFHQDVEPILRKHCQGCHRPGEPAPMSLLTYKEARPWAKAMREAVRLKKMPPWFADPHVGKFANERSLTANETATLAKWADAGAPEGDLKHSPAPASFVEGWNIGKPDMVVEMPSEFQVPPSGTIEYTYFIVPTGFTEDRWVRQAEIRPGNRSVVHHVIAFIREPGSKWLKDARPGVPYVPEKADPNGGGFGGQWLVGYAPGFAPDMLEPGQARLVKAGSDIVLQMHYTANGRQERDRSKVGIVFAQQPPKQRIYTLAAATDEFTIPHGAANHRVDASIKLDQDVEITSLIPHMHLRGKAFEYRISYPDGRKEAVLRVPRYDFNWQLTYVPEKPIRLPKGAVIETTAWYDNSPNNPNNPDPKSEVRHGDQSWEEMMIGFFNVAFDPSIKLQDLVDRPPRPAKPQAASSGE